MTRTRQAVALCALLALVAACAPVAQRASSPAAPPSHASMEPDASAPTQPPASADATQAPAQDALLDRPLTDVRTGETFTLAELATDAPVLLEPMAVWCSNCRAQQHEVTRAHDAATFHSVSLDVDLSEVPADLAAYADREGFDWRFAMAGGELYRHLQDRFGIAVTNPPSTPLIVIEPDGSVRPLEFGVGVRSADDLIAELEGG
jgi:hypothetical protein